MDTESGLKNRILFLSTYVIQNLAAQDFPMYFSTQIASEIGFMDFGVIYIKIPRPFGRGI